MKNQKGITLVALVITIIVLLILAAVTINLTLGERGIFNIAQIAAKNYTDAAEREETELANFQNEINNTLNGLGSGVVTKPEEQKQNWSDITAANYGDYVNYEDGLDLGSSAYGHKTDWRIFYKDNDGYVYLISSYLLKNSDLPTGTNLKGYEGKSYSSYWVSGPSSYTDVPQSTYDRYMMNFKYNGSPNNGYVNMRCVSQLMNTSVWSKFVNTTYAIDAIGAPTLEMWVNSWNTKSVANALKRTVIIPSIVNQGGYYVNGSHAINLRENMPLSDSLYFPIASSTQNDLNGYTYFLSSPSPYGTTNTALMCVQFGCDLGPADMGNYNVSVRPIVRLKNTINAEKVNGVWELK